MPESFEAIDSFLAEPLSDATTGAAGERARRETLRAIESLYEFHGGFRLKTLARA